MTTLGLPHLKNCISFNKALRIIAKRLFLRKGGTLAQWQRWIDSLSNTASLETEDVSARLASIQNNQFASQHKAECLLFLMDEAAPRMREMILQRGLPAYINAEGEGLFLANPAIFEDERLFEALRLENARVSAWVAERCPVLETWKHDYSTRQNGHVVFLSNEVERALNYDFPLLAGGNDNNSMKQLEDESQSDTPESTLPSINIQSGQTGIARASILFETVSSGKNNAFVEASVPSPITKNKGGAPKAHEQFACLGKRVLLGKDGIERFDPSKYDERRQFAAFRRAVVKEYDLKIDEKTARRYLRPIWDEYMKSRHCVENSR